VTLRDPTVTPAATGRYLTVTAGVAARYIAVIVRVPPARYPAAILGVTARYITDAAWDHREISHGNHRW